MNEFSYNMKALEYIQENNTHLGTSLTTASFLQCRLSIYQRISQYREDSGAFPRHVRFVKRLSASQALLHRIM